MKRIAKIARIAGIADIARHRRDRKNQKQKCLTTKDTKKDVAPLFAAQRDHGIDSGCASRGNVAGKQGNSGEQNGDAGKSYRVG